MESMVKKLSSAFSRRKKEERRFLENGSIFLKELIADCNGKSIPLRTFSSSQILKATKNFDSTCFVSEGAIYKWFKGIIEDKYYLIKRFHEDRFIRNEVREPYNDIVLSARMSNHSNFLKLVGCCFEFSFPVFLFEYAEHGVLNQRGCITVNGEESILPWSVRLKMGKEIANAVTYLHMAFPKITIHRDINPKNIFLDKNWTAKLSDFSLSITLPEGKSRIEAERVGGSYGYLDPLHYTTKVVTEYTDVYSFGACLLVFLTGRPPYDYARSDGDIKHIAGCVKGLYENGKLDEVIDPMMAKDITSSQRLQVEACVVLALRCCEERDEDRPKMIQVAKELKRIERIEPSLGAISGFLKPEMLEDGSSMVKWTNKFGIKIEIMLILSFCIAGCLIAVLFRIVDEVMGTFGYMDPIYYTTSLVTEYTDVFSFGIFMLVLLLGRPAVFDVSSGVPCNILDYVKDLQERGESVEFGGDLKDMRPGQMKMFLKLALRCCEERNEDRPKMILVAKEIKLIEGSLDC